MNRAWSHVDGLLLMMAAMWGANFSVIKVALAGLEPLTFASIRFLVVLVMLVAVARIGGQSLRLPPGTWPAVAGLGLLANTLYQLLFVFGMERTTATNASLILATVPVFVAVIGRLAGVEQVRFFGWVGILLSLAGVGAIITGGSDAVVPRFGRATLAGDLLILLSTIAWSVYGLAVRPVLRRVSPVAVTVWATAFGTLPLLLIALPTMTVAELQAVPAGSWVAMVVYGLIRICLPYLIWNYAVRQVGSARTSLYSYLTPLVGVVLAAAWLGERLTLQQGLGGALALAGVVLARLFVSGREEPEIAREAGESG